MAQRSLALHRSLPFKIIILLLELLRLRKTIGLVNPDDAYSEHFWTGFELDIAIDHVLNKNEEVGYDAEGFSNKL